MSRTVDRYLMSLGIKSVSQAWHRELAKHIPPVVVANKFFHGSFDGVRLELFYIDRDDIYRKWEKEIRTALGDVILVGYTR